MYVTKGDTPAAPLLVLPVRGGEPVDLDLYADAAARIVQPDGTLLPCGAVIDRPDDDEPAVAIALPTLDQAGLVLVSVTLTAVAGGKGETFDVEPVIVQDLDGWHTLGSARAEWESAAHIKDARLYTLLQGAREACVAFKPSAGARRPSPTEREAQLLQARNRYAASGIDPATGDDGVDGYAASAFPMDWAVKALLYPPRRLRGIR